MADNVKVAVRVRPFNDREKGRKATSIIKMSGQTTEIYEPDKGKAGMKSFTFDHSYWSHDGYKERKDGYLEPKDSKYADQRKVFDDLGKGVLENAWKGYNCSLFAYGQTGSGKSYSMVGYGQNKGIVPISCEELFNGIEEKKKSLQKGEEFQVTFSMLEIYNEQVRDLLNVKSLSVKGGLKVREHPSKGFYVDSLQSVPVKSYQEIDAKMQQGTKNRTVASTNMNATSSRAHTIVAINFTQKTLAKNGQNMTKSSIINLVDLAGSERAASTGASGDRLKEGSNINQSLSTLGNCIKALADESGGKKKVMVPFRNSVLTKLLKNALGGNSKTVMIAALSPADINYEETLSTLRFADRAKAIKTKAVINESPTDKLIRELREENEKLKKMMAGGGMVAGGGASNEEKEALEEELKRNQEEMETMQQTWEQKLKEKEQEFQAALEEEKKSKEQQKVTPHFWNLNEDPSLTGMVRHFTPAGKTRVGNQKADPPPQIQLSGLSIQSEHALVTNEKNKVVLKPCANAKVLLNGNEIKGKKELHHNDRVMFGHNHLFVFHHPQDMAKQQKSKTGVEETPTYDSATQEIAKNSGITKLAGQGKSPADLLLQEELFKIFPMVGECNAMSEELDKKCQFEIVLVSPQARGKKEGRTEVCVKLRNLESGNEWLWDSDTFINRKFLMQEMYQDYVSNEKDWDVPQEKDPFWEDPNTPVHIGGVFMYLQSLAYLIDLDENLTITDYKGVDQGHLFVGAFPCTPQGKELTEEYVDGPEELVGKDLHIKLAMRYARGLPTRFTQTFCKYRLYLDDKYTSTDEKPGMNPDYTHEKQFDFRPATKQLTDYLSNEALYVEVWGKQKDASRDAQLNTQELMIKDKSQPSKGKRGNPMSDHHYKMAAEANTYKKRMERAEEKLRKLTAMCDDAKKSKQTSLKVEELEKILHGGKRLKAVAGIITQTQKMKRPGSATSVNSQACSVQ